MRESEARLNVNFVFMSRFFVVALFCVSLKSLFDGEIFDIFPPDFVAYFLIMNSSFLSYSTLICASLRLKSHK